MQTGILIKYTVVSEDLSLKVSIGGVDDKRYAQKVF